MPKFEYCSSVFETHVKSGLDEYLQEMGQQGWELVAVTPTAFSTVYADIECSTAPQMVADSVQVYLKRVV